MFADCGAKKCRTPGRERMRFASGFCETPNGRQQNGLPVGWTLFYPAGQHELHNGLRVMPFGNPHQPLAKRTAFQVNIFTYYAHLSSWMWLRKLFCLCVLTCLATVTARAQVVFSSLFHRDGLSSKEVLCTYTDSEGFVWCGTPNGLNRWDGSHFRIITPYSKTFPGLLNETVYALTEWGGQKLWVGTKRGLSCLDKANARFTTIPFVRDGDTLADVHVSCLVANKTSRLWAGTYKGLFVYDRGAMRPASTVLKAAAGLDTVICVTYHGANGGHDFWVRADSSVYYLDPSKGIFYAPSFNPLRWKIFGHKFITALGVKARGQLVFAAYNDGLFHFDPAANIISRIPGSEKLVVQYLYPDRYDRVWISGTSYETFVAGPDDKLIRIPAATARPNDLAHPSIHHIQEDRRRQYLVFDQ